MSKKITALLVAMMVLLCSCSAADNIPQTSEGTTENITEVTTAVTELTAQAQELSFRGVWLSYIEISANGKDEDSFRNFLDERFEAFSQIGITDVFFHVRPFADALYESDIFPSSSTVCKNQGDSLPFDYLALALAKAQECGVRLHGWINPYRVSRSGDITSLCQTNQARIWFEQGSGEVFLSGDRYYFNPSRDNVRRLIVDGVTELMEKYPALAGVHTDDYFYPEGMADQDAGDYAAYLSQGGEMSLGNWRRENVSLLMSELYSAVKSYGNDKIFSISPDGKPAHSRDSLYADVELWCSQEGYCDIIIPQIYFGFENEKHPFDRSLDEWISLCQGSSVRLVPGLALYKCGSEDKYAGQGKDEWLKNSDIIKRQVELIGSEKLYGFALYSGTYVNFYENFCKKELDNLISVL